MQTSELAEQTLKMLEQLTYTLAEQSQCLLYKATIEVMPE